MIAFVALSVIGVKNEKSDGFQAREPKSRVGEGTEIPTGGMYSSSSSIDWWPNDGFNIVCYWCCNI